ncbi:MAG: hypothetical protein M3Y45_06245 [Actinomycetota bacterium]|nr:hypothetical protein [Actinomycetota bacterium]
MRNFVRAVAVMAIILCGSGVTGASAGSPDVSPAAASKVRYDRTVIYNMFPSPKVRPARYFLTANSGPYMRKLKWKGWGTAKAVGRGRFISDCASCGPKENKPARLTFFKLKPCHKRKVMTYSFVKIKVIDPERTDRVRTDPMPCL